MELDDNKHEIFSLSLSKIFLLLKITTEAKTSTKKSCKRMHYLCARRFTSDVFNQKTSTLCHIKNSCLSKGIY